MAEAIFRSMVDLRDFQVSSAGLFAFSGESAANNAIIVCADNGINLSSHVATAISDINVGEMDLILTATHDHRDKIKSLFSGVDVYTIKEFAGGYDDLDIADPIGRNLDTYKECFLEIRQALLKVHQKLL